MKELLVHPRTKKQTEMFVQSPSHALLIVAPPGSGKLTLAQGIAAELLGFGSAIQLQTYPYFTHIKRPDVKQDISIDSVRGLNKLLRLKVPGSNQIRRVIVIENAHDLNEEAQNAMLKMLEEPAPDCIFILTAASTESLLPTIASRAQQLHVQPIKLSDASKQLSSSYGQKQIENAWNLSQGSAGLLLALLRDDKDHPLKKAIEEAKDYLRKDKYERLLASDALGKDKNQLRLFLDALLKLLAVLHSASVSKANKKQQKKLIASRKLVYRLREALDANVSTKFITLKLALELL